jgi:DNA-binding NtrC family response regulator
MNDRSFAQGRGRVLVVDDHAQARESMTDILQDAGHDVRCCCSAIEALKALEQWSPDVILTDLQMPGMSGIEFIRAMADRHVDAQTVMVTAHATVSAAVDAMRLGAFDFIEKPFDINQLEQLVDRALRHSESEQRRSSVPAARDGGQVEMIGSGTAMQALRQQIARVGPTEETVLISGESGTGKELVARTIHAQSRRADQPMVSLNCPALSPQLMESELFGHERGAFTGADARRIGRFELADRGTVLLDEVTEIELALQAKLLRVLQERAFERVGSSTTRGVDVRVLATTNRDLLQEVQDGRFRQDLYYRLAVVPIHVPPLRQRREDIPTLADHFLRQSAERLADDGGRLTDGAYDLLVNHPWPGNVRELENVVTRASVLRSGEEIDADQLANWLIANPMGSDRTPSDSPNAAAVEVGTSLQDMERTLIEATLEHFDGHRAKTATALGIGVRTLANKLRSYGYAPRAKSLARAA